jgi:hypothetical protein
MPKEFFDDEVKTSLAEKEAQLKSAQDTISNFESKEINFKQLKDLTEAEKAKLSSERLAEMQRAERLEAEIAAIKEQSKKEFMSSLIREQGLSQEDAQKVLLHMDLIKDEPSMGLDGTNDGIRKKFNLAYNAAKPTLSVQNPIYGVSSTGFGFIPGNGQEEKPWIDTDEAKNLASKLIR